MLFSTFYCSQWWGVSVAHGFDEHFPAGSGFQTCYAFSTSSLEKSCVWRSSLQTLWRRSIHILGQFLNWALWHLLVNFNRLSHPMNSKRCRMRKFRRLSSLSPSRSWTHKFTLGSSSVHPFFNTCDSGITSKTHLAKWQSNGDAPLSPFKNFMVSAHVFRAWIQFALVFPQEGSWGPNPLFSCAFTVWSHPVRWKDDSLPSLNGLWTLVKNHLTIWFLIPGPSVLVQSRVSILRPLSHTVSRSAQPCSRCRSWESSGPLAFPCECEERVMFLCLKKKLGF